MPRYLFRTRRDAALRATGALLLAAAARAAIMLGQHGRGPMFPGAADVLLALLAFLGASIGAALFLIGDGLFDIVDLPARWTRRDR